MSQLSARPIRIADSTALPLTTGIAPGRPRHVGQVPALGSPPKVAGQPQNIFDAVLSSTCTSSPRAGSKAASTSSYGMRAALVLVEVISSYQVRSRGRAADRPTPAR